MSTAKPLKIIAGPCLAESLELLDETASHLKKLSEKFGFEFYFKASYRKANRSSINSYEGPGDRKALSWLGEIKDKYGLRILTDIHSPEDAEMAAETADVLQIPAFLSRQTDIITAAAKTGKTVNIKKGQFMAPDDMKKAAQKASASGNEKIWLTERGTFFGYHDLVVDYRSLLMMKEYGYPVIYDATHSLQQPSVSEESGGLGQFVVPMANAAVSLGIDGVFFETHPDPANAKSDKATQLPLKDAEKFLNFINEFYQLAGKCYIE